MSNAHRATESTCLISITDASRLLGVSRATVYRLIEAGDLPLVKIRGRALVPPREVEGLIARSTRSAR